MSTPEWTGKCMSRSKIGGWRRNPECRPQSVDPKSGQIRTLPDQKSAAGQCRPTEERAWGLKLPDPHKNCIVIHIAYPVFCRTPETERGKRELEKETNRDGEKRRKGEREKERKIERENWRKREREKEKQH